MNIFTIAASVSLVTLILTLLGMWLFVFLCRAVAKNEVVMEAEEKVRRSVNPSQTAGLPIAAAADYNTQLFDARKMAAKIAANKKRGENVGIGRLGTTDAHKEKKHVSVGVKSDPLSAVKIAKFHSWKGLEVVKAAPSAGPAAAGGGATKTVKRKLEPGKDFAWVDFSGLTGGEKRQAIIANGKAKSAAYKAAKAAGLDTMTVAAGGAAAGAAAVASAPAIELPPAPTLTKITDDMEPADKRKAMIANSKAKSAYNKQLKSLDIDPKEVEWTEDGPKLPDTAQAAVDAARAAAPAVSAAAPAAAGQAVASNVTLPPAPEFTVITDDMDPADKRKAMIGNSKAKSAYNKELKAAGIDPKTVEWTDDGPQVKGAVPAAAPPPQPQGDVDAAQVAAAGLAATGNESAPPPPELIPITADMDPNEKRAATIANSKAKSAYKKELKALGIDPKSIKI